MKYGLWISYQSLESVKVQLNNLFEFDYVGRHNFMADAVTTNDEKVCHKELSLMSISIFLLRRTARTPLSCMWTTG